MLSDKKFSYRLKQKCKNILSQYHPTAELMSASIDIETETDKSLKPASLRQ